MSKTVKEHAARVWMLRTFLEGGEEFYTPPEADDLLTRYELPFIGLDLPKTSLEKIYSGNFRRLYGDTPKRVDLSAAVKAAKRGGHEGVAEALKGLR